MPESGQRIMAAESEASPLRHAHEMVIVLDGGERIVCWNRAAEERFHFGSGEASGACLQKVCQLCCPTPEERGAAFAEALARGAWKGHCARVLDGERIDIESAVSVLLDANGESVGRVITVREVPQRNRLEAAQADRSPSVRPPSHRAEARMDAIAICASCKAMRDAGGDWQPAEEYVGQRFTVAFTHGMCPECIRRFYPDLGQDGRTPP